MKVALSSCAGLLMILAGVPVQAVEPLALYDDFNAKSIDASKWSGEQSGRLLEVAREIHGNRLRLAARAFGSPSPIPGEFSSRFRLPFTNPAAVTAIEATVAVRKVEATGCPGNPLPTRAQMRLSGFFFNTGTTPPPPDNGTNDVLAFVRIERFSDSADPEGVLRVRGILFHCSDPNCNFGAILSNQNLGSIEVGGRVRLRIQWDPDSDQFIFERDDQPEVFAPYAVSDVLPPGLQTKRVELAHEVANCSAAGSTAFMEVFVNDVFVNASAVSGP